MKRDIRLCDRCGSLIDLGASPRQRWYEITTQEKQGSATIMNAYAKHTLDICGFCWNDEVSGVLMTSRDDNLKVGLLVDEDGN